MVGWRVGIDIGGTFTDVVAVHGAGEVPRSAKVPSRAADPVGSITAALAAIGLAPEEVQDLIHGTTRVTNAIVEGRLEPVALIATDGFEDIIEIGRQSRRELYRLDVPPKPAPLVPRDRRVAAGGRIQHDGTELLPLTPEQAEEAAAQAAASGVRSVAIALLHAYANPAHEQAIAARLKDRVPFISLSHVINPEAREYERTIATVLNAAVMPLAGEYLARLHATLPAATRLSVMHSAGGMASPEAASERPLLMALSGPAAGVAAAAAVARETGESAVLSFDMGGTTTDVALILDGQAEITADAKLADQPLRQPMVAIESIGAGGGSIVRHGPAGLSIGPQSAGAEPGPACYGRGGDRPTVCDANAILGYLNPRRKLGGEITLDRAAAVDAFAPLAKTLGVTVVELALGVLRVADATMARALNKITVERGMDGRGATLLAFGGMGPMHAIGLARSYGMSRVLVPAFSSAFSALGCVVAETSYTRQRTLRLPGDPFDATRLASVRRALAEELRAPLLDQGHAAAALVVEETAMVRYRGQSYAVDVAMNGISTAQELAAAFEARHDALFGFASGEAWELLGLRVRVRAPRAARIPEALLSAAPATPFATDACWFESGDPVPTPRHDRALLSPGVVLRGPTIIEDDWSTTVVPPGWRATPDARGNIVLTEEAA